MKDKDQLIIALFFATAIAALIGYVVGCSLGKYLPIVTISVLCFGVGLALVV